MKKIYYLGILGILLFTVTGCGSTTKTMTCTKTSTDEDGYKTTDTLDLTIKDDKVVQIIDTNISETDPDFLDFSYNLYLGMATTFNKVEGINMTSSKEDNNKIKFVMTVDLPKINESSLKETLGDLYDENNFYSEKDITLEKFKEDNLKDYTCE